MFVYGIFIWGCAWEKTTGDLLDSPPRHGCTALPVVHITCHPVSEKPILQDPQKAADTFSCPVYHSRTASKNPVMEIDVRRENILATRWSLRGLSATIRPYWKDQRSVVSFLTIETEKIWLSRKPENAEDIGIFIIILLCVNCSWHKVFTTYHVLSLNGSTMMAREEGFLVKWIARWPIVKKFISDMNTGNNHSKSV